MKKQTWGWVAAGVLVVALAIGTTGWSWPEASMASRAEGDRDRAA